MTAALNTFVLLVLMPASLWWLSFKSGWGFYRKFSSALFGFWFLGVIEVVAMTWLCEGNILFGLNNCLILPQGMGNILAGLGLFSMAIAAALWVLATLVMLGRAALARSKSI